MSYAKSDVKYSGRKVVFFHGLTGLSILRETQTSYPVRGRGVRAEGLGRRPYLELAPCGEGRFVDCSLTPLVRRTQVEHVWSVSSFRIVVAHKNVKSLRIHVHSLNVESTHLAVWRCSLIVVTSEEVVIVPHEMALLTHCHTVCHAIPVGQLATHHCPLMLANRISSSSRMRSSAASFSWRSSTFRRASMRELGTDDLEVDPETDATSEAASLGAREAGAAGVGEGAAAAASACFWRRSTSLSWSVAMRSPQHCLY
jgi:hypothetical protein